MFPQTAGDLEMMAKDSVYEAEQDYWLKVAEQGVEFPRKQTEGCVECGGDVDSRGRRIGADDSFCIECWQASQELYFQY